MSTIPCPTATAPSRRSRELLWRLTGLVIFVASSFSVVRQYLVRWPEEIWQVDLEVYREGARSLLLGRSIYDYLTSAPQYLPMTYPPFAAVLGLPLALIPFATAGWLWTLLQLVLLWVSVGVAFRPFLRRFGVRAAVAQGAVAGVLVHLQPVAEGIRFGQVNAIIVTLCLIDVARPQARRWPRGSLVAIATAVKLTPAVFWIHWAVVRRWRTLAVSVTTAILVTVVTFLLVPAASADFWTHALLDPGRLGPNAGTSNQSMRGVLMRVGPQGTAQSLTWLALVAVVGVAGFALSARLHRLGEQVAVVATVGLLAVLISPVSWIHHLHWGIVVIAALLGDARRRSRVVAAVVAAVWLYLRLPWQGGALNTTHRHGFLHWYGVVLENSYTLFALVALLLLWLLVARGRVVPSVGGDVDITVTPTGGPGNGGDAAVAPGAGGEPADDRLPVPASS